MYFSLAVPEMLRPALAHPNLPIPSFSWPFLERSSVQSVFALRSSARGSSLCDSSCLPVHSKTSVLGTSKSSSDFLGRGSSSSLTRSLHLPLRTEHQKILGLPTSSSYLIFRSGTYPKTRSKPAHADSAAATQTPRPPAAAVWRSLTVLPRADAVSSRASTLSYQRRGGVMTSAAYQREPRPRRVQ